MNLQLRVPNSREVRYLSVVSNGQTWGTVIDYVEISQRYEAKGCETHRLETLATAV